LEWYVLRREGPWGSKTYIEELNVVEDMVVEGEVVGRDDVNACILLNLPVGKSESLGLGKEVFSGELIRPVCLSGLFEISKTPYPASRGQLHHSPTEGAEERGNEHTGSPGLRI
jgi:hypothetical protein